MNRASSPSDRRGRPPWADAPGPDEQCDRSAGPVDRMGRMLPPGSAAVIHGGEHDGQVAEVVGWGGRRGVEVVVHGARPAFLAAQPAMLELVDVALLDPIYPRRTLPSTGSSVTGRPGQPSNEAPREPQPGDTSLEGAGAGLTLRRNYEHLRA